jgi:hypothetical protein
MRCVLHKWKAVVVPELVLLVTFSRGGKLIATPTVGTFACEKCGKRKIDFFGKVPPVLLAGKAHHWVCGVPLTATLADTVIQIIDENVFESALEYSLKTDLPKPTLVKG